MPIVPRPAVRPALRAVGAALAAMPPIPMAVWLVPGALRLPRRTERRP